MGWSWVGTLTLADSDTFRMLLILPSFFWRLAGAVCLQGGIYPASSQHVPGGKSAVVLLVYRVFEASGHGAGVRARQEDFNNLCPCPFPAVLEVAAGPSL